MMATTIHNATDTAGHTVHDLLQDAWDRAVGRLSDDLVQQGLEALRLTAPALTVQEAAQLLRVSSETVRALVKRGELPAWQYGAGERKTVRISPKAIEDLLMRSPVIYLSGLGGDSNAASRAYSGPRRDG